MGHGALHTFCLTKRRRAVEETCPLSTPHPLTLTKGLVTQPHQLQSCLGNATELRRQESNHSPINTKGGENDLLRTASGLCHKWVTSILDGVRQNLSELKDGTKDVIQKTL